MKKKRVLIVEDDKSTRDMLEKLINEMDMNVVCYKAAGLDSAYSIIHENIIDVFLLDVILDVKRTGDVSGINLAQELRAMDRYKFTPVIFITSLEDPKYYAYSELRSFRFIEKPFTAEEVRQTLEIALECGNQSERKQDVCLRKDGILLVFREKDIVYTQNKVHMIYIHTVNESVGIPYVTCKSMLEKLDENKFVQCNRNTIVNKEFIKYIDTNRRVLGLIEGRGNLLIGSKYMRQVLEYFKN